MSSKGAYGIGDVCLEPLRDVWSNSQIRINNKLDHSFEPLPCKQGNHWGVHADLKSHYFVMDTENRFRLIRFHTNVLIF